MRDSEIVVRSANRSLEDGRFGAEMEPPPERGANLDSLEAAQMMVLDVHGSEAGDGDTCHPAAVAPLRGLADAQRRSVAGASVRIEITPNFGFDPEEAPRDKAVHNPDAVAIVPGLGEGRHKGVCGDSFSSGAFHTTILR